jgi:hypothetical protein
VNVGSGFKVSIRARDAYGNTVTTDASGNPYNPTVTLSCNDGGTQYLSSVTLGKGIADPSVTLNTPANAIIFKASGGGITAQSSASVTINGVSGGNPSTDPVVTSGTASGSGASGQLLGPGIVGPSDAQVPSYFFSVLEDQSSMTLDKQAAQAYIALYESILQQQYGMTFTTTNVSVTQLATNTTTAERSDQSGFVLQCVS